ncbi:MAG: hypothetical protein IJ133_06965 [Clostridia bacterium]|nr:hypothetical protein [Clostridia bacterium]
MKNELDYEAMEREILSRLLDKYEGSRTYRGTNKVRQKFAIRPDEVFPEYRDRFTPVERIAEFDDLLFRMEQNGLIRVERDGSGEENAGRILFCEDSLSRTYEILGLKPLFAREEEQMLFYKNRLGISAETDAFCKRQIDRAVRGNKLQYDLKDAENLLKLWKYLLKNRQDILERELSLEVLGDSKLLEKTYRNKLGSLMEEYGEYEELLSGLEGKGADAKAARCRAIFESHQVFRNPSYLYVKGPLELVFPEKTICLTVEDDMAFSSGTLERVTAVKVNAHRLVTVENLTSFHRVAHPDTVYLYLGGYHNTAKQNFLRRVYEENAGLSWFHFGDLDPDGYYILKNLRSRTGIPFEPLHMGVPELEEFAGFCKPVEKNDLVKAQSLLEAGEFVPELSWILEHGLKLEQEIISWRQEPERRKDET